MKTLGSVMVGVLGLVTALLSLGVIHRMEITAPPRFASLPMSDPGAAVDAEFPKAGASNVVGERVVIIGDFTDGSDEGGVGVNNWTSLVGALVEDQAPIRIVVDPSGGGGSGYVARGTGLTFPDQARRMVSPATEIVVISGSRNDIVASPVDVKAAASETYQAVAANAPAAQLIVVGPTWTDDDPPRQLLSIRDAVSSAAAEVGAAFVDPIADGWLSEGEPGLVGGDNVQPTDSGHARIAELMAPVIGAALKSTVE